MTLVPNAAWNSAGYVGFAAMAAATSGGRFVASFSGTAVCRRAATSPKVRVPPHAISVFATGGPTDCDSSEPLLPGAAGMTTRPVVGSVKVGVARPSQNCDGDQSEPSGDGALRLVR